MRRSRHPLPARARWWWHRHPWARAATAGAAAASLVVLGATDPGSRSAGSGAVPVAVAAHDLPVGATIGPDDLVEATVDPGTAARAVDRPMGRVVTGVILAGEPVVAGRVAPAGRTGAAALVPPGHRAVALPVTLAAPPVEVGDRVDVLVATGETFLSAEVAARAATVVARTPEVVTVAMESSAATAVAEGLAGGLVTMALLGPEP